MSESRVECPSGLIIDVRGLRTKEANLLADRQALKAGTVTDAVLTNCWLRTIDPGPYAERFGADGKPDWSVVHVGDRLFTLIRIRAATFGEEYIFPVNCPDPACRERFEWEVKLSDLPVRPIPEAARAALKGDGALTATLDGREVRYRLMRGADELKNVRLLRVQRTKILLAALNARIVSIDGVEAKDRMRFLEELDLAEANRLLDTLDAQDGGVETEIQIECPHCGATHDIRLPFGPGFLMPRTKATTTDQ